MPRLSFVVVVVVALIVSSMRTASVAGDGDAASKDSYLCPISTEIASSDHTSEFVFSKNSKDLVSMTTLGDRNEVVIMIAMPGILIGPLEMGGASQPSNLYVSDDFGKTFDEKFVDGDGAASLAKCGVFTARMMNGLQPSPVDPKRVVVVGYDKKGNNMTRSTLWISKDSAKTWTCITLDWRLDERIHFHPTNPDLLMARSRYDDYALYLSRDFGATWTRVKDSVRTFHWGFDSETIFLSVDFFIKVFGAAPNGKLYKSTDFGHSLVQVLDGVHSFGLEDKFLYASVAEDRGGKRLLRVSTDNGATWRHTELPDITPDRFYSILDMDDGLIFIHVADPYGAGKGTLYTSGGEGVRFSESLEDHLFTSRSQTDFYHVKGARGVFITSKVNADSTVTTVISHDRGGHWSTLPLPTNNNNNNNNKEGDSLNLHISYSLPKFAVPPQAPLSIPNAKRIIVAQGGIGNSLDMKPPKVYISSDGGRSWNDTLLPPGFYFYRILDFGGLIVAYRRPDPGQPQQQQQALFFSTDLGSCWRYVTFTKRRFTVRGLNTEPDGHSLLVGVWGMDEGTKEWVVVNIDFQKIIPKECEEKDYEVVSPGKCYLGEKVQYTRLRKDSFCHNDPKFLTTTSTTCHCTYEDDYECDYGYEHADNNPRVCVRSPHLDIAEDTPPKLCLEGKVYAVRKQKFRKIPGDKCDETDPNSENSLTHDLDLVKPVQSCEEGEKGFLLPAPEQPPEQSPAQRMAIAAVVLVVLLLFALMSAFFVRKFLILGRENGRFRYSRVPLHEQECESLLPDGNDARGAVLSEESDADFDLEMELERGLADLGAHLSTTPAAAAATSPDLLVDVGRDSEPPVSTARSGRGRNDPGVGADSDDELIA